MEGEFITPDEAFDKDINVPSAPGTPQITGSDETSVNLIWDCPKRDGGSKIHGYKIEYKDPRDGSWKAASDQLIKDTSFRVPNLLQNTEYEFRVKAKNAAGFSIPNKPTASFKLKTKSSVPSPPLNVKVGKVGKSYVYLNWDKPRIDGGSKITGYIIEHREKDSNVWIQANDYMTPDCAYAVINLAENHEYEFRIMAVNAAGKSDPSSMTMPIKVSEAADGMTPKFIKILSNKSCNLKNPITLECEGVGKPFPTARWFKNAHEIHPAGRIVQKDMDTGIFKLVFSEVWDTDEGEYTCELSNTLGAVKCSARLIIAVSESDQNRVPLKTGISTLTGGIETNSEFKLRNIRVASPDDLNELLSTCREKAFATFKEDLRKQMKDLKSSIESTSSMINQVDEKAENLLESISSSESLFDEPTILSALQGGQVAVPMERTGEQTLQSTSTTTSLGPSLSDAESE